MNINPITNSAVTNDFATQDAGGPAPTDFRTRMQQAMAPVAQLFGTTPDQLMDAVRESGGTLADYAASKGISSADLTAAIKKGLQANAPNGVQLSDTQLTNIADRIANHKPGHHHGGHRTEQAGGTSVDSSTIKTDLDKLMSDLKASNSTDETAAAALDQQL